MEIKIKMFQIAQVVLYKSTRQFDKPFTYIVPSALSDIAKVGMRVSVPFGAANRTLEGIIVKLEEVEKVDKLKQITNVIDETPSFDKNMIALASWMKTRYICTYGDVFKAMTPPGIGLKSTLQLELTGVKGIELNDKEVAIVNYLLSKSGSTDIETLKNDLNIRNVKAIINKLENKGVIKTFEDISRSVKEKTVRVAYLNKDINEIIEEIENSSIKRIQQIKVLELLMEVEYVSVQDILTFCAVSISVVNTLHKKGYIAFKDIEIIRTIETPNVIKSKPLEPTDEQKAILDKLKEYADNNIFKSVLLHGITGSGKTEVYLQLIDHCLKLDKDAIVLVPEISLTPQMVERFKGRFGEAVAVIHSRLSPGERYDQWRMIRDGKIKVAVGARSAVFAPFKNLGAIIIDEEHESSYKSEVTPKYHAREVAYVRCKLSNSILVLGSATPSIETYYSAKNNKIELFELNKRANNMVLPKVEIIDMREELNQGNRSIFSRRLAKEMQLNLDKKEQTILFLNRRGHSSFILCRSCGITLMCPNCNVSLTHHSKDQRLICHYCGYTLKTPKQCPKCNSSHIRHFGTGTQKVEEQVRKEFQTSSVIRMDMDTTTGKNSHRDILSKFKDEGVDILVGTQMIAKGHDFPKVTLVGVLAADSLLNTGDFRATEKTFQLLTQVAGRAGRAELAGRVIVQTYDTDNFSILCASNHDYKDFYEKEIALRYRLGFPPFTNIASLIITGKNDEVVHETAQKIAKNISEQIEYYKFDMLSLGPARAPITKINDKYRWRIIIKCANMDKMIRILTNISDGYYDKKNDGNIGLSIEINPLNMY